MIREVIALVLVSLCTVMGGASPELSGGRLLAIAEDDVAEIDKSSWNEAIFTFRGTNAPAEWDLTGLITSRYPFGEIEQHTSPVHDGGNPPLVSLIVVHSNVSQQYHLETLAWTMAEGKTLHVIFQYSAQIPPRTDDEWSELVAAYEVILLPWAPPSGETGN